MNYKLLVLDESNRKAKYQVLFAPNPAGREGSAAIQLSPLEAHYSMTFTDQAAEALRLIEKGVLDQDPYVGCFLNLEVSGSGNFETLKMAKALDPNLLCVVLTSEPDKHWTEINQLLGEKFVDHWELSKKPLSDAQVLQKSYRMSSSWERRRREREYQQRILQSEEQLVKSERMAALGTLARGLGAEFGNTLHGIMAKADLALQKRTPDAMELALKQIVDSCESVAAAVRNLQGLVKTDGAQETVNLANPIDEAAALLEFEMKKLKVKLVRDWDGDMPTLKLNRFEISQVFLNIMINAIHAMEKTGGTLTLKTVKDANGISISFGDTGCGIAPETMPKIFEPLFTTKSGSGSGIGLSVTKKIVENHGGKIKVASAVGKGTTFTIWLPK